MSGPPRQQGRGCPVRWSGRQAVVVLPGQVGLSNAGPVGEQLLAVLGRGATVLIADMTATRSCDHAGTDALARVYQRAVAHGTELRLVIPALAVRRAIALSGLDQLVPVFPALEAAQAAPPPLAAILPLPPPVASNGPAAPPGVPRPVTRLPVASSVGLDGLGPISQQGMRQGEFEDTLTRITGGIFHAGITLQAALGHPAEGLREAAGHTLDLLDETIREARDAAFASRRHAAHGLADAVEAGIAVRLPPQAAAGDLIRLSQLRAMQARRLRARSQQARARALKITVSSAASRDRVAAILAQAAASDPRRSAHLRALSQTAASHAAWIRQRAHDHAATG